jgi:membrane protein DedA with SNARE-associated domain
MHEFINSLIVAYGYYALFIGTCLEGETIMFLAGVAARDRTLEFQWVVLLGFLGSLLGDQSIFFVSRMWGKAILRRFPRWHPPMGRVNSLLERHGTWYMLSFRFFYGLRNPTPFVVGISSVKTLRFVSLNVVGAALWSTTVGGLGYLIGMAFGSLLEDLKWVIIVLASVAICIWIIKHLLKRRRARLRCPIEASPAVDALAAVADPLAADSSAASPAEKPPVAP